MTLYAFTLKCQTSLKKMLEINVFKNTSGGWAAGWE